MNANVPTPYMRPGSGYRSWRARLSKLYRQPGGQCSPGTAGAQSQGRETRIGSGAHCLPNNSRDHAGRKAPTGRSRRVGRYEKKRTILADASGPTGRCTTRPGSLRTMRARGHASSSTLRDDAAESQLFTVKQPLSQYRVGIKQEPHGAACSDCGKHRSRCL